MNSRNHAANIIARALLDYAEPEFLPLDVRYGAADAALDLVDAHLAQPAATLLSGTTTATPPPVDTQHDTPEADVDERAEQLAADVERRWADLDTLGQPGWLARARQWLVGDHHA